MRPSVGQKQLHVHRQTSCRGLKVALIGITLPAAIFLDKETASACIEVYRQFAQDKASTKLPAAVPHEEWASQKSLCGSRWSLTHATPFESYRLSELIDILKRDDGHSGVNALASGPWNSSHSVGATEKSGQRQRGRLRQEVPGHHVDSSHSNPNKSLGSK